MRLGYASGFSPCTLTASDFIITAAAEEPSAHKGGSGSDVLDVSKVFAETDTVVGTNMFDNSITFVDPMAFADSGLERWGQVYQSALI
jgi:hypothetical protein